MDITSTVAETSASLRGPHLYLLSSPTLIQPHRLMEDLVFTASPESDDHDSIEVRIVGVKNVSTVKKPDLELYRDGEKIELERPGRSYLDVVNEVSDPTPVLRLTSSYVEQVFGLDHDDVCVKLDRDWRDEFEEYKNAAEEKRFASARAKIEENPGTEVKIDRSFGRTTGYFARGVEDDDMREYLNHLLSTLDGVGVGEEFEYEPEWDGGGYCETQAGEILRRADQKKERERKERERKKREERKRREAEQEAAEGREILRFHCELQPHTEDLSGVVLNRPAPSGGAFLMHRRIPKEEWSELKEAGAWYWSKDDLEQMDMFWSDGGWRYSLDALEAALDLGYAVQVGDDLPVTSVEELRGLFFEEA